jgi:hypothetical protein
MIASLFNLQSRNDGGNKTVSVSAVADAAGGTETIHFQILDQTKTKEVTFAANQGQIVSVSHTAEGVGLVAVTVQGSKQSIHKILNVDAPRGEGEMGQYEPFR